MGVGQLKSGPLHYKPNYYLIYMAELFFRLNSVQQLKKWFARDEVRRSHSFEKALRLRRARERVYETGYMPAGCFFIANNAQ